MKNILECIEKIKNHPDVLKLVSEVAVPDAMQTAHYKDALRGVWWYHPATKKMLFSTKASSHMAPGHFPEVNNFDSWKRGRVFKDDGRYYIMMYSDDFPHGRVPGSVVDDVYQQITRVFNEPISDFVDQEGYSLLGE
jgi:hypothetical protein